MRILLTNDDGYNSEGLHAVASLLSKDHDVAVVAPSLQRSAASHSITLRPNSFDCREIYDYGYKTYAVDGSPVDCVKTALSLLFKSPDLVISGINCGENLGSDIMYSGTVSAASDAVHLGCRAVALSLDNRQATRADYDLCAEFVRNNLNTLVDIELPPKTLLNINFPNCKPLGVVFTKMNTQITFVDTYSLNSDNAVYPEGHRDYSDLYAESDEGYCRAGYITVTPLLLDRTDYATLNKIKGTKFLL